MNYINTIKYTYPEKSTIKFDYTKKNNHFIKYNFRTKKDNFREFIDFIFARNGTLYPANLSGQPIKKLCPAIEIKSFPDLVKWKNRNIRRFIFRPVSAGLIGIDCDCKNNFDGVSELKNIAGNIIDELPFTQTPNNGRHYYFFADQRPYVSCSIAPGCEIKYRALITVPGSVKDNRQYKFIGNPADVSEIPEALRDIMPIIQPQQPAERAPQPFKQLQLSLDKISTILERQGTHPTEGNRNYYVYAFAKYAVKNGYSREDIIQYLSFLECSSFSAKEIQATTRSATRRGYNVRQA